MMSLNQSITKKVKLNCFQIYTFLYKFQKRFKSDFPNVDIELDSYDTKVYSMDETACIQAQKRIKSWVVQYRVEVMKVNSDFNSQSKTLKKVLAQYNSLVFQNAEIKRQLKQLNQLNLILTKQTLEKKMFTGSNNIIVVVPKNNLMEVKKIIRQQQKQAEPISTEIDLKLPDKKILISFLMGFLYIDNYKIKLINKNDTLWVKGLEKIADDFKKKVHQKLQKLSFLIFDAENQEGITKIKKMIFPFKLNIFDSDEVQQASEDLLENYQLQGPLSVHKSLKESKPYFLIIVAPLEHRDQVKDRLEQAVDVAQTPSGQIMQLKTSRYAEKPSKYIQTPKASDIKNINEKLKKDLRIKICDIKILTRWFKDDNLKQFLNIDKVIDFNEQIQIMVDPSSQKSTIIELKALKSYQQEKKRQKFYQYFHNKKYHFQKQVNSRTIDKIINTITQKYPDSLLEIDYISGFSPYTFNQIKQNYHMEVDLIQRIKSKLIKKNKQNNREFFSFVISGLRPFVIQCQEKLEDTFRIVEKLGNQQKYLRIKIPSQAVKYLNIVQVEDYFEKYATGLMSQSLQQNNFNPRLNFDLEAQELVCEVKTTHYSLREDEMEKVKIILENMFDSFDTEIITEKNAVLDELQKLYPGLLFIKQGDGIVLIGFKQVHKTYSAIKKLLNEKVKTIEVDVPLHLKSFVDDNYQEEISAEYQYFMDQTSYIIQCTGDQKILKRIQDTLNDLILKGEQQMLLRRYMINKQMSRYIQDNQVFKKINKIYPFLKLSILNQASQAWKAAFSNGNIVHLIVGNDTQDLISYKMFLNKKKFQLVSDKKYVFDHGNFSIDHTNKCFFVDSESYIKSASDKIESAISLHLNSNQKDRIDKIFSAYQKDLLPVMYITMEQKALKTHIQEIQSNQLKNSEKVEYGYIQHQNNCAYNKLAQEAILRKQKEGCNVFLLKETDLEIKQLLFDFNRNTQTLTYKRTSTQFSVRKDAKNKRYLIDLNGKTYNILQRYYDSIQAFQSQQMSLVLILYQINLTRMIQTNLFTNFERKIYRNVTQQNKKRNYILNKQIINQHKIIVTYHKSYHDQGANKFNHEIRKQLQTVKCSEIKLELDTNILSMFDFVSVCEEKQVYAQIISQKQEVISLFLRGYDMRTLKQIVQDYKIKESEIKLSKSHIQQKISYPKHWVAQKDPIQKMEVPAGSQQFKKIEKEFAIANIKKLYRIQNQIIWKKYSQEKIDLETITEKVIKQLYLFHGTRAHNPQNICFDKEQAFNINFSSDNNMFGRGIYFAKHAKYSNDYYHQGKSGKQMLYCKVMVGESQAMVHNYNCHNIKDTQYANVEKKIKYESITSTYGGTDVYIIYKSRRAYPEYLIEY